MRKRAKTFILLFAILAVLIVIVVLLNTVFKERDTSLDKVSDLNSTYITLINEQQSDVEYIDIKNEYDEYRIELVAENMWGVKSNSDYVEDESLYYQTTADVAQFQAIEQIEENSTDLSKYGLDNPRLVFTVSFKTGNVYNFTVGDLTPDGDFAYIIKTGEDDVYTMADGDLSTLFKDRYQYINKTLIDAFISDEITDVPPINYVKITRPDLKEPIIIENIDTNDYDLTYAVRNNIMLTSPIFSLLDNTTVQDRLYGDMALMADAVVATHPDTETMKKYGFDTPTSTYELTYSETTSYKFMTGDPVYSDESKKTIASYYLYDEATEQIYLVAASKLNWMTITVDELMAKALITPSILNIDKLTFDLEGKDYTLDFTLGEDKTDASQITAKLNGKEVDANQAKAYLRLIMETSIQGRNTQYTPDSEAKSTITYHYYDGRTNNVEVFVNSDRRTIISFNGNADYLGRAGYYDKLVKEISNLINGNEVDTSW